jgi:hypothetical protein
MAKKYDWGDGKGAIHTISKADHDKNVAAKNAPPVIPVGTYDPGLDAQERQSQRSLQQQLEDIATGRTRATTDFGLGQAAIDTQRGQTNQSYQRSLSDLLQQRTRGGEDYQTNLATLQRNYQRLGTSQGEAQRRAGAHAGSGAAVQAARKRSENQALDRAPIQSAYDRFTADSATGEQRLGEDKTATLANMLTQFTRGGEDLNTQLKQLGLNYSRGGDDYTTAEERAGTGAVDFTQDINAAKLSQYLAGGYAPIQPAKITTSVPPRVPNTLYAGPDAPVQPGALRTRKKKGRNVTYGTSVMTA